MNEITTTAPKAQIEAGGKVYGIVPKDIDQTFRLAQALARAGDMVPESFRNKPDQIMAAVMRGAEIGLAPMQALSNIAVINGRASLWGDALPALMQRAGHHIDVVVAGDGEAMVATATLTRGDTGKTISRTFSVDDAKAAGLWGKQGPWRAYPKRMLSHRARAWACRDGAADALMGLAIAEEQQDVGPDRARDVTPRPTLAARIAAAEDEVEIAPEVHWTDEVDTSEAFPADDAFQEGAAAFSAGVDRTACPYGDHEVAGQWLGGWDLAKKAAE